MNRSGSVLIDPYRDHSQPAVGWERSPLGLLVPTPQRRRYQLPVAVDLFAGAGGFGCGLHQAGYHVAAASDAWDTAAITYLVNLGRPGVKIHFDSPEREADFAAKMDRHLGLGAKQSKNREGLLVGGPLLAGDGWISGQPPHHPGCEHYFLYDVRKLTGALILNALGLEPGEVALVTGGPPCQGFSAAGKKDVMDPRNSLIFEFARLVVEIQPKAFVMENVPGLLSMTTPEGIPVIDAFCHAVADGGYGEYDALRKTLIAGGEQARAGLRKGGKDKQAREGKRARRANQSSTDEGALFDLSEWGAV